MGTIIVTGANGSLAIPTILQLLVNNEEATFILTVRNTSDTDLNTRRLRSTILLHPGVKASIHQLDLADLDAVHTFTEEVASKVTKKELPPLVSILCTAYHWNMTSDPEKTKDNYEKTIQINHISHAALVLLLLGSFDPESGGRVVLFTSDAHDWSLKNGLQKYPPHIPDDLDALVDIIPDSDNMGRGFQRYANSKLAIVMWTCALNRYLVKDESLKNITAVVVDPGNMTDSRALRTNTPQMLQLFQKFGLNPLRPILRMMDPSLCSTSEVSVKVARLATNDILPGERGYLRFFKRAESSKDSRDEGKQQKLWAKTLGWAKITKDDTALAGGFKT